MRPKPDNRRNNVQRIQKNIDNTNRNIELAKDMMEQTNSEKTKHELSEKNQRREDALDAMKSEIRDEAKDRENGYQGNQ